MIQPTVSSSEKYQKIMEVIGQVQKGEWTGHNDCLVCGEQAIFTNHTCRVILPIHIGDVLYWKDFGIQYYGQEDETSMILGLWKDKRKPLKLEDTELIDYIYNLLS